MSEQDRDLEADRVARRVVAGVERRAAMAEATGILAVWGRCGQPEARATLRAEYGRFGEDAEAARVMAASDADADGQADPDWR